MTSPGPAHTYYEACTGRWRAPIAFTLTDTRALGRSGMSLVDRLSIRLLAVWPAWLGRVHLDTTVAFRGPGEVVHTTVVRWLRVPLQKSVETFSLDPDGRRFTVRGSMTGSGVVDPTATRAEYTLFWLGVELRQRTVREGDRVTVEQEGPGFRAHQELQRQAP